MAPTLFYTAASTATQPGAGLVALDWFAAHPVVAGILLGVLGLVAHVSGCKQCHVRHRRRWLAYRKRRSTARDRALGRSE